MHLPMQSEPVQRAAIGQPNAVNSAERTGDREHGIQPSGIFDDIANVVGGVTKVAQAAGPALGMLGGMF